MSLIIFNLTLKKVVRETTIDRKGVGLGEKNNGILEIVDDTALLADSKDKPKEQAKKLINAAKRIGLEINTEKPNI